MDTVVMKGGALLLTDSVVVPVSAILSVIRELGNEGLGESDVLVVTQASQLRQLPIETTSQNIIVFVSKTPELVGEQWLEEIARVLKPGGITVIQTSLGSSEQTNKGRSVLERKLLVSGFLEVEFLEKNAFLPSDGVQFLTIKAKKPSWRMGSSFSIKKTVKTLPKVQINDELDLIDEDSLLTEEDLKKPQLPLPVGDCEVGSTRKACKNCSCGRAEEEEKVQKLGLTAEQINNPQSACGSCGLGDAFRCGGCPYKGLPPFKIGEKVTLAGNFLTADI